MGYWSGGPPHDMSEQMATAERLGFDSAWSAEAYGSDAFTPLAWWGSQTESMNLGTAIAQMAARTPAATAMAAMTMDHLTGGRFILGLGVSGPQVVEGWYGQPYAKPLARTREYVDIVRQVVARQDRLIYDGDFYEVPLPGGTGLGKALKSNLHPRRTDLPIYLAAEGPKNVALAAEIADGWLPFWFSPQDDMFYRKALQEGFDRTTARRSLEDFEVAAVVPVVPNPDLEAAADLLRPMLALYIGGMGSRERNFHKDVFVRMGFADEADRIQDLYLDGRRDEAMAAVPLEIVESVALIGSPDKIREDLRRWHESVVTTLLIQGPPPLLEMMAELVTPLGGV